MPEQYAIEQITGYKFFVYGYLALALVLAIRLVYKPEVKYRFELGVLSFYLMTGNLNDLLKIKIPGVSFFEIQPERLLFLLFSFFLVRQILFVRRPVEEVARPALPMFKVFLYITAVLVTLSQLVNIESVGVQDMVVDLVKTLTMLVLIYSLQVMSNENTFQILGKSIVIGAVSSTLIGFVQLFFDPEFMRLGIVRLAYGDVLRSNGLFGEEYYHSYFLIIATVWVLVYEKREYMKILLLGLFSLGVLSSFHRMSLVAMAVVVGVFFIFIRKVAVEKLAFTGLMGMAGILIVLLFFSDAFLSSSAVKNRLLDSVGGRKGYYTMVFDHIGEKPMLGFGNYRNDVYYYSMLEITRDRKRATGETGSIHNGYLEAMFYYGIPAFCCFVAFILLAIVYFGKLISRNFFFAIPFMVAIIYGLSNLTNTFIFSKYLSILFAIHIGLGMGARYIPAYFDQQSDVQTF